ncbi:MAG: phosphomannomutase [Nitrospirae bacterium]|nr:MAG: phosphomannomutase [Nitrospirota bacterium]
MTPAAALTCFKAYDIRGRIPDQLNPDICYRIGRAYGAFLMPKSTVVGHDVRLTSPVFTDALIRGLTDAGSDVIDIGLCGTEEVYFHTFNRKSDGGIMVTASHNPIDYNGMKLVHEESRPISGDSGLSDIRACAELNEFASPRVKGSVHPDRDKSSYLKHLLGYVDASLLKPLRIVTNAGNGSAGIIVDALEDHLPFEFIRINHEPDGAFPNGIPNPLLPENRSATEEAVKKHGSAFGIAWDGDFDRCFFFDEKGRFIEGYYIVGLIAAQMLAKHPGAKIIHDPRLTWNTIETVKAGGGISVQSKTGHAFIKERMREEDAAYGGEMSGHHYFRDFAYCDSGMIPWLFVAEYMSMTNQTLSSLVDERIAAYPCSGELNFRISDAEAVLEKTAAYYFDQHPKIDRTDGLSMEFSDWRFNLRSSNTEPLLRLNVETKGDSRLLEQRVAELSGMIRQ